MSSTPQVLPLFQSSGDLIADRRYGMAREFRERGDHAAAIDLLEQTVERTPGFAAAWFDLGHLREVAGDRDGAVAAFEQALAADPADRHGAGLRLRLLNIGGHAMSADYVRSVFDQYAAKFDDALAALRYTAPELLAQAVADVRRAQDRPVHFAAMLDLGCGTGLSGAAFRPVCDWIEGVDLSPGMIAQARRKKLYDKLDIGDLTESLDRCIRADVRFNLIVAADVFVYCADLTLIASLVRDVLADKGLFAFTVETHGEGGVILGPKLRYAHGEAHVRTALEQAGLTIRTLEPVSTRMEADVPVPGLLVIAERAPSSPLSPR
ncbi:MAG: methyltransferase domain-containing protein [Pseudomonadota bacterium]